MSECLILLERCQQAGEKREYGFNWTLFLARRWAQDTPFGTGARVRPSTLEKQNGFEYESSGGQSGGRKEPPWPRFPAVESAGATYADGSLVWTARALSNASLSDRIDTSSWAAESALALTDDGKVDAPGLQQTYLTVAGGVAGATYDVVNEIVTLGGKEYQAILRLTIV